MLFGYYVFLRRCESDYLHRKPLLNMFRGGFLILYPKSYPKKSFLSEAKSASRYVCIHIPFFASIPAAWITRHKFIVVFAQFRRRIYADDVLFHEEKVGRIFQLLLMDMWSIYILCRQHRPSTRPQGSFGR